jgi:hypothetical protein
VACRVASRERAMEAATPLRVSHLSSLDLLLVHFIFSFKPCDECFLAEKEIFEPLGMLLLLLSLFTCIRRDPV